MSAGQTTDELRKLPDDELVRDIRQRQSDIFKLRLTIHLQKEKDTVRLRKARRMLARLQTVLRERKGGRAG